MWPMILNVGMATNKMLFNENRLSPHRFKYANELQFEDLGRSIENIVKGRVKQ